MTKGYGITISDIDNSCPADLLPYQKAFYKAFEYEDEKAWLYGRYVYEAFGIVMHNAFSKRGRPTEYPDKPHSQQDQIHEMTEEEYDNLSEEEKEKMALKAFENAMSETLNKFEEKKDKDHE